MKYINWSTDIFEGFYDSGLYNSDTLYYLNQDRGEDIPEMDFQGNDYEEFEKAVAQDCAGLLLDNMQDNDLITKIDFIELDSPRYYNFETDKLVLDITCDWQGMINYIKDNSEKFNQYLQENFTSRSGFISFIPNNYKEFMQELENDFEKLSQVIIEFYILQKLDLRSYKEDCYESAQDRLWQFLTPVKTEEQGGENE
jgi:hypothetical protein